MRWQTGETRHAVVFIADNLDVAAPGLAPTCAARRVSDGTVLSAPTVAEVGGGFYRFSFTAPSNDSFVFLVDAGATLDNAHRYVPVEIPAGGYPDQLDAAVSSRSSAAAVAAVQADTTTLLARLTSARAALLDNLDAAITSRESAATGATIIAFVDELETRLTAARAILLDNLSRLDVAVSTRATPADVVDAPEIGGTFR